MQDGKEITRNRANDEKGDWQGMKEWESEARRREDSASGSGKSKVDDGKERPGHPHG